MSDCVKVLSGNAEATDSMAMAGWANMVWCGAVLLCLDGCALWLCRREAATEARVVLLQNDTQIERGLFAWPSKAEIVGVEHMRGC